MGGKSLHTLGLIACAAKVAVGVFYYTSLEVQKRTSILSLLAISHRRDLCNLSGNRGHQGVSIGLHQMVPSIFRGRPDVLRYDLHAHPILLHAVREAWCDED